MSERDFRGVWIPAEIWLAEDLSLAEKCLLVEIDSLDCSPRHCFKSNEKLAAFLGCSVPTVTRGVKKLASKGLVSFEIEKTPTGSNRVIKSLIKMIRPPNQNDETPTHQNDEHSILPLLGDKSNTNEKASPSKTPKEQKHKHGEFQHVLLTDTELEKLKKDFPLDWEQRIQRLDEYIEMKGATYKNHSLTIQNWARRDKTSNTTPLFKPKEEADDSWRFHDPLSGKLGF